MFLQRTAEGFAAGNDMADGCAGACLQIVQEHRQHGRHEVQHGDCMPGNHRSKIGRVLMALGTCHNEGGTGHERQEPLPDGNIETDRGFLQNPIGAGKLQRRLHPVEAIDQRAMGVAGALRLAGAAGSIDQIGQIVRHKGRNAFGIADGGR